MLTPARTAASTAKVATLAALKVLCVVCVASALSAAGCGSGGPGGIFKQYEYEEEMYLSLDGSATLYVNSSIAALNALRGTSFDASPSARVDRNAVREYFTTPATHVVRVSESRRSGRRFVHVRLDVSDVRQLHASAPFAWSTYSFEQQGNQFIYKQVVGAAAGKEAGVTWKGDELTAFRMHLPSKIDYHNTPTHEVGRGNILGWEQPLAERLKGAPLEIEARMETQSILYRTLWLFGVTALAAAVAFAGVIWWIVRGGKTAARTP